MSCLSSSNTRVSPVTPLGLSLVVTMARLAVGVAVGVAVAVLPTGTFQEGANGYVGTEEGRRGASASDGSGAIPNQRGSPRGGTSS